MIDAIESLTNASVGLFISVVAVWTLWPLFGWAITPTQSVGVSMLFWGLSAARTYVLRRIFRWLT